MPWVGEDRHDQRLDQGEPMLSLWLVSVAGGRQGTVQLAQEHHDGLFVHHGGLSVHGHHPHPLDLASAAMCCSLATPLVTGHFPSGTWETGWRYSQDEDGPWPHPGGWRRPWRLVRLGPANGAAGGRP